MRYEGYCQHCGDVTDHLLSKDGIYYFCTMCGSKETVADLEDLWFTFNLSKR